MWILRKPNISFLLLNLLKVFKEYIASPQTS